MSYRPPGEEPSERAPAWERATLALLILVQFPLAIITYNYMGEDAFISFRYAEQFAAGHGLVFTRGEYVEGYSNLLWVLVLSVFHLLGVRIDLAARVLSVAAIGALMLGAWLVARRLSPEGPPWLRLWLPLLIAVHPLIQYHKDRGLETVPYAVVLAALLLGGAVRWPAWVLAVLAASATWLRPEGVAFAGALAVVPLLAPRDHSAAPGRSRIALAAAVAGGALAAFVAQTAFRWFYYDALLPNTMAAKAAGSARGLRALLASPGWRDAGAWVCSTGFLPLVAAGGALWALGAERWRAVAAGVLIQMAGAVAFLGATGSLLNEAWRYLAPAFLPTAIGCWLLLARLVEATESGTRPEERGPATLGRALLAGALLFLGAHTWFAPAPVGGTSWFQGTRDAPRGRFLVRLGEFLRRPDFAFHARWYASEEIHLNAQAGRWLRGNLPADALMAADQLGQMGYYAGHSQRFVDLLGLMDRRVARDGGPTVAYLLERNPEFIVVLSFNDSRQWPEELRGRPMVPFLRTLLDAPEVRARWTPHARIVPRETLTNAVYVVYRRDQPAGTAPVDHPVGLDTAAFDRLYRVLEPAE